jgi:pimeloyl-ACP methyl ester carboxylesterase
MITRRTLLAALLALAGTVLVPAAAFADNFKSDRITVKAEGAGSDVILIPGLGSSPRVWAEMIKAIPNHRYHVIQVSGFAGQAKGGNADGLVSAPVAEEIARYIAQEGIKKPAVIGHSMGGTIGMMLAARHPQAISKLMVVDMFPFLGGLFGPPGTTPQSITPTADALRDRVRNPDPAARQQRTEATINSMINTVAMRPAGMEDSLKSDADVVARAYHELIVTDLTPELPKIAVPTTVLYVLPNGSPIGEAQIDAFYQAAYAPVKGATLKRIPNSAHFIMWDQPERFQSEVKAFLN